ncbi:hypothetical protein ILUMI_20850 [Ignelater luminosus]|uniref:Ribonuclease P/MRP protein subunit POP5 n=1 Tax=Ignelater luminosus TaxID=2038154 RepID=A0A8K0CIW7_IGNLU|nr:hypothetical protein ILUMI_20850 [Ignelater luminosus]
MVRHKNRYIVIEINSQNNLKINQHSLHTAILTKIQQMHGDFGMAAVRAGFIAKYINEKTRIALIKARHGPHKLVGSCLPCVNVMDNKKVNLTTLYTGATMRHCFKFVLNHQQKKVNEVCATLKTYEEKEAIKEALLNFDNIMQIT